MVRGGEIDVPIRFQSAVLAFLGVMILTANQLGCDRSVLNYPPPTQFTLLNDNPDSGSEFDSPSTDLQEIASATYVSASVPGTLLAAGGIASDVRTTRTFLPGPAERPDAKKLNEIAGAVAVALDEGGGVSGKDFIFADEAPTLPSDEAAPWVAMATEESQEEEDAEPEGDYKLGPGDTIDVSVWDTPELDRSLVVRPDGFVSFPLIREIRVEGVTPSQLAREIEARLTEHILEPEVNVVVTSFSSKVFYVFGAVASPGVFPYIRNTTLLQAIITVGGLGSVARFGTPAPYGDISRIRIIRTHENGREIITKNLKGLTEQERLEEDIPIQADDVIYIPEKERLAFVFGEVLVPGIVPITEDSRILEAVLASGGLLPTANKQQVLLIRPGETSTSYWVLNLKAIERGAALHNIKLEDRDIVFVPQKFIAKVAEFVQLYSSALQPAMETYLTSWDAWFVHERFGALRKNNWGLDNNQINNLIVNPDQ